MDVALSYDAPSDVETGGGRARVRLAGAKQRPRVRWRGAVKDPIALREALLALHEVVIADFRWKPPESRHEFEAWLQGWLDLHGAAERARVGAERRRALEYRWAEQRGAGQPSVGWVVLDPVVSVHDDQVSFEAFSRDGGAYARVGVDRSALEEPPGDPVVLGTTNVDFSSGFYEAVRRLRSIWRTELALGYDADTSALDVATHGAAAHREKKIDLPDSWARGFVQLGAASLLESTKVELLPVHVHDLCRYLRLHKAKTSPRALRWELTPGQPAVLVYEPWEHRVVLTGSVHDATEPRSIRIWGRNRLRLIERVIPLARRFVLHLLGRGLPYFVTARGDGLDFTLGLSGWTKSGWTSTARLDALIARRRLGVVDGGEAASTKALAWLEARRRGTPAEVAAGAGVSVGEVHANLADAASRGLVVYDLLHGVYRYRPLLDRPLPPSAVLGDDPEEVAARALVSRGAAVVTGTRRDLDGTTRVDGRVTDGLPPDLAHVHEPRVSLSDEGSVTAAECGCFFAKQHGLKQGPCAHERALLLIYEG